MTINTRAILAGVPFSSHSGYAVTLSARYGLSRSLIEGGLINVAEVLY